MPLSPNQLPVVQQRTRLIILLKSEQAKLDVLVQQAKRADPDSSCLYDDLITKQTKAIAHLEQRITHLTDQLEGPDLRRQLKAVEASLESALQEISDLKQTLSQTEGENARLAAEVSLLATQTKDLQSLNETHTRQIAVLSLHKRQNAEDHAHTVLALSQRLAELGLNIPATASTKVLDGEPTFTDTLSHVSTPILEDEQIASDPNLDQTIFSRRFRCQGQPCALSLVVNSVTLDLNTPPLEIKLTESQDGNHHYVTRTLTGFSKVDTDLAASYFAKTLKVLMANPADIS